MKSKLLLKNLQNNQNKLKMSLIYGQRPDFDKKCLDAIFSGFGDLPLDKVISNIQHTIDGIESDIESAKKIDLDIQNGKIISTPGFSLEKELQDSKTYYLTMIEDVKKTYVQSK